MAQEIWLPVVGYERIYSISNMGRLKTTIKRGYHNPGMRKAHTNRLGYLVYPIKINGIGKNVTAHRLVAKAFISNPFNKHTVNHIDGDKLNNNVSNLEWATHSENNIHALKYGLRLEKGSNNPNAKLTEVKVMSIRHCKGHASSKELAKMFNVSVRTINRVLARDAWGHV